MSLKVKYIIVYIIIVLFSFFLFTIEKNIKTTEYLKEKTNLISDVTYLNSKIKDLFFDMIFVDFLILFIFIFIYKNHQKQILLKTIIEEADSGIGIMDLKGDFKKVNSVCTKLLGYEKDVLLQLNCFDLTFDEDKEKAKLYVEEAIQKGFISKVNKRCTTKDGSITNLEFSLKLLPSSDKFIVVINSLEDKIQLQNEVDNAVEQIRQKDMMLFNQSKLAALGEMIDAIAHQWKSPLGIIKLYSQSIEFSIQMEKDFDKNEIIQHTQKQALQVDHLINTMEEFRSFFRPATKVENIPIKAVIDSVIKLMSDELIRHLIDIEIKGDTTAVFTIIPNEFKHVLINLFSNARDAFNENNIKKRKIIVDIQKNKSTNILKISDNAGGIPKHIMKHIFESNFTTKEKGTGVGLYMSKQIIEKIEGKIEAHNEDNGVSFTISFQK